MNNEDKIITEKADYLAASNGTQTASILAEHGLAHPLTVCRDCRHYNENTGRCESEEQCRIKRA